MAELLIGCGQITWPKTTTEEQILAEITRRLTETLVAQQLREAMPSGERPRVDAICARLLGSVRRECLDHPRRSARRRAHGGSSGLARRPPPCRRAGSPPRVDLTV